ncbi:MAG: dienelactone hydrolase family protein [Acidobacteriota bacterium]|jgi:carboxymethylenebutenolidase
MKKATDFSPEVLELFDKYVHGGISRRQFLDGASKYAVGGMTAVALLHDLEPAYAEAQKVAPDDPRLSSEYVEYSSPQGAGTMRGLLARPAAGDGPWPGVVVVHENRGLNPHIEDVARRVALEDFIVLAPDALTPLGGYPGTDDEGRRMQGERDRDEMFEDFVAAVEWLQANAECTGRVGAVGFCYGGGVVNGLAVRIPDLGAAVPFYGGQPASEDVAAINAPLQIHYGGLDERVNAGWPAYQEALDAAGKSYEVFFYEGANHGFNNDTTPRYDEEAADLAWERTIAFFNANLR